VGAYEGPRRLTPFTELAMKASRAEALAADRVTGGSLLTLTDTLAASSMEARGTG
jgi:hypothetical protein